MGRDRKVKKKNRIDGTIGNVHKGVELDRLERYKEDMIGSDRKAS
jgi:hypothetical protein